MNLYKCAKQLSKKKTNKTTRKTVSDTTAKSIYIFFPDLHYLKEIQNKADSKYFFFFAYQISKTKPSKWVKSRTG